MSQLRIAVVGGGIFGVTAAVKLAQHGYSVDLLEEKRHNLLMSASGINQYRLHRGYHYPRSPETASSCRDAEATFREEYSEAIIDHLEHYYCISKRDSLTTANQFLNFCKRQELEYRPCWTELVRKGSLDLCVRVREALVDPDALRSTCWRQLRSVPVNVHLGIEANEQSLASYDLVVISTYVTINSLLGNFHRAQSEYQFELCEKPVVWLPQKFQGKSIVILDGPFMCIDPYGRTGLFVLDNVVHSIHQRNIGKAPIIHEQYNRLLNNGIIQNPPVTNFNRFLSSAAEL